jgi:2,4-dienoyl-CoA reductase (NADPH2)
LIVTGGIGPNTAGKTQITAGVMVSKTDVANHKVVTEEVHKYGGAIAMQILHTGRYVAI